MIRIALAALLLSASGAARAQTAPPAPPQGIVDDPCAGIAPIPPAIVSYMQALYAPGRTGPVPPFPPEAAGYRAAQLEAAKTDWPNLCRYRAENAALLAGPAAGRRVVFLGDSITQGWLFADPALFTGGTIDRGISGQTSPQMLLRFMADVVALRPGVVHIMAGTNDVAGNTGPTSAQDYRDNIAAMVALARANGIRVVLASIPPAAGFAWKPGIQPVAQIRALNAWLAELARSQGQVYVDYYGLLATAEGALRPDYTFDGVHPNHAGYMAMRPLAQAALAKALGGH